MLDQSDNLNLLFLGCALFSDLCSFQEIVILDPCLLSLIDKVATVT